MHLQIPVILAFGAGLASTMALPATNSTLEKRSHYGWVGSFTNPTCAGDPNPNGQRPELTGGSQTCHTFQFIVGDAVGVNFGSGIYQWEGVTFYSDANCQTVSEFNNWRTVVPGPSGMACVQPAPGTVVNSIMATEYISPS